MQQLCGVRTRKLCWARACLSDHQRSQTEVRYRKHTLSPGSMVCDHQRIAATGVRQESSLCIGEEFIGNYCYTTVSKALWDGTNHDLSSVFLGSLSKDSSTCRQKIPYMQQEEENYISTEHVLIFLLSLLFKQHTVTICVTFTLQQVL